GACAQVRSHTSKEPAPRTTAATHRRDVESLIQIRIAPHQGFMIRSRFVSCSCVFALVLAACGERIGSDVDIGLLQAAGDGGIESGQTAAIAGNGALSATNDSVRGNAAQPGQPCRSPGQSTECHSEYPRLSRCHPGTMVCLASGVWGSCEGAV